MALQTYTITGKVAAPGDTASLTGRAGKITLWPTTVDKVLRDSSAHIAFVGEETWNVEEDGTIESGAGITLIATNAAGLVPAGEVQWTGRYVSTDRTVRLTIPPFELEGNTTFDSLLDVTGVPITSSLLAQAEAARDEAVAAAAEVAGAVDANDSLMTTVAEDTGSDFRGALNAAYAARWFTPAIVAADTAAKIAGKSVIVIFRHDDIQPSALDYLPNYETYGLKASWYICPNMLGHSAVGSPTGEPFITEAEMDSIFNAGHEIGSHTNNHAYFNTGALTEAQRREEMRSAKAWLEQHFQGTGYACETFAFPGNQISDAEVLDYYYASLSAGPASFALTGLQTFVTMRNGYYYDWLDNTGAVRNPGATLATDRAVVQAKINTLAAVDGGSVAIIQAHNQTELTVAQHEMMLDEFTSDSRVAVITMREWLHYCRHYRTTQDGGKTYYKLTEATTMPRNTGPIVTNSMTVQGSNTLDRLGDSVYFKTTAGGLRFRIYQTAEGDLAIRDQVNARALVTFRQAVAGSISAFFDVISLSRISFSASGLSAADMALMQGAPTTALGSIGKGAIRLRGDGDADATLYVKTAGSTGGWKLLAGTVTRTSAQLLSAADTVNTDLKAVGRQVFDTTLNKPVWATGTTATSTWVDATGTVVHTPV